MKENSDKFTYIIESDTGTGSTTKIVLDELRTFSNRLHYTFTDISTRFLRYGHQFFSYEYPFIDFKRLNIDDWPQIQGFEVSSADIVVATDVLHATVDIQQTPRHIKPLLKPGGILLINEIMKRHIFPLVTFRLTPGWWLAKDPHQRIKGSPY